MTTRERVEPQPIAQLLSELEANLKSAALWQATPPSEAALASQEPFAIDTLAPHEWLQWIFLPRFRALLAQGASLPKGFALAPYFEEAWKPFPEYQAIIVLLQQIDKAGQ